MAVEVGDESDAAPRRHAKLGYLSPAVYARKYYAGLVAI